MWILLFPVGKIPGGQEQLQLPLAASGKGLQHLSEMALDGVDGDGHLLRDFHVAIAQAGVSGCVLLSGCQAIPAQQVVVGSVVFTNGKGEQPVNRFRDGQPFFFGNVFNEGNEVGVYFGKGFWPNVAVLLEDVVKNLWRHTDLVVMRSAVRQLLTNAQ